ncbi:MAG TPA: 6-phosphogluconolactonase, partial [Gemmatimonadaceae bacterium]|nr:6-phosphogluconolactonase [Gemmatimonadaceae bacterium]
MQSPEKIPTVVCDDPEGLSVRVADRIEAIMRQNAVLGRRTVLGLATGSTPIGVYRELIRRHREQGLGFADVVTFNLDEYWPMAPDSIHSYHRFMRENFFAQIDIPATQVHLPAGMVDRHDAAASCAAYEAAITAAGGIDFQLLGIGKTGHIGFNEPGSGRDSRTRLVTLDAVTRKDASADFFGAEHVPREAITMGVATILEAREIAILATGEHKAGIVRRAVEGAVDLEVAATFLQAHPNTTFYLDAAASVELTRIATPWLVDEVTWDAALAVRAVAWLSKVCGKAILKLTQQDYAEHRLSSLVAVHGSPGAINGFVFNSLGARIRGKSKLHREKRVICFSPHPDDDVISMGGILRKLVENRNSIAVAYMTSGNIAVFDHDVRRHLDFLVRMGARTSADTAPATLRGEDVRDYATRLFAALAAKRSGEVDLPAVQDIKRIIRETEAVSGLEVVGLTRD